MGHEAFRQSSSTGGQGFSGFDFSGFDFGSDAFEEIFETFFGGRRSRQRRRASDLRTDLSISLEDAAFGVTKTISVNKRNACSSCNGTGGEKTETCGSCRGSGYVGVIRQTLFGTIQTTAPCNDCHGTGKTIVNPCTACGGEGFVYGEKKMRVDIPAGVEDGSRLRVRGEGDSGTRGEEPGDLYVFIHVKEHEFFEREGNDIKTEIPISFIQAVFGDELEVPTLNSKAKLKIPKGTQSGTTFRMKGKGIPYMEGYGSGDQYVSVNVEVPTKLSKKQKELLEEFAKVSGKEVKPQEGFFKKLFG